MRLQKELDAIIHKDEFLEGHLKLISLPLDDSAEIDALRKFIMAQTIPLTKLTLRDCTICEQPSVRSISIEEYKTSHVLSPSAIINKRLSRFFRNKADAVANLIAIRLWQYLDLSINNLSSKESETILKVIHETQPQLRFLNFSFNAINKESITILANYLKAPFKSSRLKTLILQGNFTHTTTRWLSLLLHALEDNKNVREVDLSNNSLTDKHLEEILKMLSINHYITKITFSTNTLSKDLIDLIQLKLNTNCEIRNKFHEKLLSKERLLAQALTSIREDDPDWLDVLIGIDKKEQEEELLFNQKQLTSFFLLRKIWFHCSLAIDLKRFFDSLTSETLDQEGFDITKQLDIIFTAAISLELSIIHENLSRVSEDIVNGKLVTLTTEGKANIIQKFKLTVIEPVVREVKNDMQSIDIPTLRKNYEQKVLLLEQQAELIKKQHDQLQLDHCNYQLERERLLSITKKLDLGRDLAHEFEEIAGKLIEVHVDPNTIIDENNTTLVLECFRKNKPNCLKLLLQRQGDILFKDKAGKSTFMELMSKEFSACHQIVVEHIQEILNCIWQMIANRAEEKVHRIKELLQNYLMLILKSCQVSKNKNTFAKQKKELFYKLEEYYQPFFQVSTKLAAMTSNQLLLSLLQKVKSTNRKRIKHFDLDNKLEKELLAVINDLNPEELSFEISQFEKTVESEYQILALDPLTTTHDATSVEKSEEDLFSWNLI